MTQKDKKTIQEKIENDITQLHIHIKELGGGKVKSISPDCGLGRLTRLEAIGELHVNNRVLDASRIRLTRLNNALQRINKPMFGICIECEENIGTARMSVRPESVKCITCASKL